MKEPTVVRILLELIGDKQVTFLEKFVFFGSWPPPRESTPPRREVTSGGGVSGGILVAGTEMPYRHQ